MLQTTSQTRLTSPTSPTLSNNSSTSLLVN